MLNTKFLALILTSFLIASVCLSACSKSSKPSELNSEKRAPRSLNIYTARKYASDDQMFKAFTEKTGIKVRTRKGDSTFLLESLKAEGESGTADLIIAADAGSLWRFKTAGLTQAVTAEGVLSNIPNNLRDPDGHWLGLSKRYRVIAFDASKYSEVQFPDYASLIRPEFAGEVCIRSSSNIYNLSLLADLIDVLGEEAASRWAKGIVDNFARTPRGGDSGQIRDIAAGECGVAIVNHYYWLRMMATGTGKDFEAASKVGLAFPKISNENPWTHTNVSAIALARHAPNKAEALELLAYLSQDQGQKDLVVETFEVPIDPSIALPPVYENLPEILESAQTMEAYGANQSLAQTIYLEAGWN